MNKKLFYIVALISLSLLVCSCTSCSDKKKEDKKIEHKINPKVQELDETPDEALFVTLDKVANDSIYVTLRSSNEKKTYGISEASSNGMIKGSLTPGNELSIFPNNRENRIEISINVTEMSGRWFYDMGQHRGFEFGKYGALSTINNVEISFREWKLLNGKLYLYFVDMQQDALDRHEYKVEEAEIVSLNKNKLTLNFRGATLHCQRLTKKLKFGE